VRIYLRHFERGCGGARTIGISNAVQAVPVFSRARVGEVQPYELQVGLAISIGGERLAPVHAALRHVARDAGDDTSFTPRHIPGSASAEARVSGKSHSSG
jgi:hypothetical protein